MKKEQIKECLENGIKMLEQGKEVEKVNEYILESLSQLKEKEIMFNENLEEKLKHYDELNDKFKDKIELNQFKREIKNFQNEYFKQLQFEEVEKGKYKFLKESNDDEKFIVDIKNETFKAFEEKTPYALFQRYGLEDKLPSFKVVTDENDEIFDSKVGNQFLENFFEKNKKLDIYDITTFDKYINERRKDGEINFTIFYENKQGEYVKYKNYGDYCENVYDELLDEISDELKTYEQVVNEKVKNLSDENGLIEENDLRKLFREYDKKEEYFFGNFSENLKKRLETYEEKNKDLRNPINLNEFKEDIRKFQEISLNDIINKYSEKNSDNTIKFQKGILDETKDYNKRMEKNETLLYNNIELLDEKMFKRDIYQFYKRYDNFEKEELPPFQVSTFNGVIYDSKTGDIDKAKEFVEKLKGKDYLDNMYLDNIKSWEELQETGVISLEFFNEEKLIKYDTNKDDEYYNNSDKYIDAFMEFKEEMFDYWEVVREKLKEHSIDDVIKMKDLENIAKNFNLDLSESIGNIGKNNDIDKDKQEYLEKEKHYKELEENPNIDYDLNYFNFLKKEYQGIVLKRVLSNELEKAGDNKYKFKDNFLDDKEKWNGINENKKYDIPNSFYIFDDSMERMEMLERYDLAKDLPPFQVYTENGDLLFVRDGKINDYDKIENFVKNISGKEYWDNMDLDSYGSWELFSLREQVEIYVEKENGEKQRVFDEYDYTDCLYQELCKNIKEETDFFNEKVRLDLKENLSDGIIEKEDIFKIAKEYYNIKKIEEILDRIDGKESTKLKEFEKAKEKANDREID
jgi:hypothetical protein